MEQDEANAGPHARSLRDIKADAHRDFAALHEYLNVITREITTSFDAAVENIERRFDPDREDPSDIYWDAEQEFGANPAEMFAHTGLMLVSRGVALSELIFASIPDRLLEDAEPIVFCGNRSWSREMAELFYWTCLDHPVKIGDGVMKLINELRDLYAHGYGRPRRTEQAERLAAELHPHLGPGELTAEEISLGFTEEPYLFGAWSTFDPVKGLKIGPLLPAVAELSPVATRRLLLLIQKRVEDTILAASWGVKDPLNEDTSKFIRKWLRDDANRQKRARPSGSE